MMRTILQGIIRHLLPLALVLSIGSFAWALQYGIGPEPVILAVSIALFAIAMALERWQPYRADWNRGRGDVATDLLSTAVMAGLADPAIKALSPVLVAGLYRLSGAGADPIGLQSLPLALQVVLATLLIELGKYWSHRLHHQLRPLWWLHALHHGSERLYTLNALRFHPLNHAINASLGMLPAMLLGFAPEALLGYLAISQPVSLLQHANLDLRSGWLNRLLSSNEVHRWHHSTQSSEANANYGGTLVIWDQVFGTYRAPVPGRAPRQIGLFDARSTYPQHASYWVQLRALLSPGCCGA